MARPHKKTPLAARRPDGERDNSQSARARRQTGEEQLTAGAPESLTDGRTYSAEAMLEQLRVNNGASEARLYRTGDGDWQCHIQWGERMMSQISTLYAVGDHELTAVDDLARHIPAFRAQLRAKLPELIRHLRQLAKTI